MKIKEGMEQDYEETVKVNSQDGYSFAVISYMQRWAELMEKSIEEGAAVSEVAEATSNAADTEGITGFMYGCAVNLLAHFWVHGEALRVWHNQKYGYEGVGTVNPAILSIAGNGGDAKAGQENQEQPGETTPSMSMGQ